MSSQKDTTELSNEATSPEKNSMVRVTQLQSLTPESDIQNSSLPVLSLSDCFPELDDPYVERQNRMMRNVEENRSSLIQLKKSVDEIKELMKKISPVEVDLSRSIMPQTTSTAAQTTFSSTESIPTICTSLPKKLGTGANTPTSIISNVATLTASSDQPATQTLPKSIFASIESLARSSNPNQKSLTEATIHIAKSIYRNVDIPAAGSSTSSSAPIARENTQSQAEDRHKPDTVNTLDFFDIREDEIVEMVNGDDDVTVNAADQQLGNSNDRSLDVDDSQLDADNDSINESKITISDPIFWKMTVKSVSSCGAKHVLDQGHILPEYEKSNPVFLEMVEDIRSQKHEHRQKFASLLFRTMCTVEDVYKKNVNGRVFCSGHVEKAKVNPMKVKDIKEVCFRCFPCTPAEEEKATRAIERSLNKIIWKFNRYLVDHFDLTPILS
jgi:hypothetical protein